MDYEVKFRTTNKIYKDYVNRIVCFNIKIIGIIFLIITLLFMFISYNLDKYLFIMCFTCFLVILFTILLCPILMYKSLINLDKKLHNGKKFDTIISIGDDIRLVEGKQKVSVDYEQINKIYEIDNILVLMFSKQNGIIMDMNGFVVGDRKSFYKYIIKKCNKVNKIIKR